MQTSTRRRLINRDAFYGVTLILAVAGAIWLRFFGIVQFYAYTGRTTTSNPGTYDLDGYMITLIGCIAGAIAMLFILAIASIIHGKERIPFGAIWLSAMSFLTCFIGAAVLAHYMA